MSDNALKLACEWLVQNECENVNPLTFGEGISLLNEASIRLLATAVLAQYEELEKARRFIAASEECAKAVDIVELTDWNERIRRAMTDLVAKVGVNDVQIHMGGCEWCEERWLHPDGSTDADVKQNAIRHAYRCKRNPMKLERDALAAELVELRAIAWTCPRCGRADLQAQHAVQHRQSCMSRTDEEQRIDELRVALGEALDMAAELRCEPHDAAALARIAELRRLT